MQPQLEPCDEIATEEDEEQSLEIFQSEEEMTRSLTRFCYGDLYVIGRLWIETLKTVLVGSKFSLIPVVKAARAPEPPKKPPPMKYKDLPIYQSPHYEYKDYLEDKEKCPKYNVKLLQQYLLPSVKCARKQTQKCYCDTKCAIKEKCEDVYCAIEEKKRDFKKYMRDPDNLMLRQGVVAGGATLGYLLGSGRGIPRRLFYTGLGALATGALCFPKETDDYFREFTYYSAKALIALYNSTCGKQFSLRERLPCKDELPPPPKYKKPQCPKKK